MKLDEFDPKSESTEVFKQKAATFLSVLSTLDREVTGHVSLSANEPLGKILVQLAGDELTKRLVLFLPGVKSRNSPENVEFWIVQKGSEGPFPVICGMCDCPVASVEGKAIIDATDVEIEFNAEISDSEKVKYAWSVTGGKIIKGQGSNRIIVRPDAINNVIAEVDWLGNEACGCRGIASFTSKFGEREL